MTTPSTAEPRVTRKCASCDFTSDVDEAFARPWKLLSLGRHFCLKCWKPRQHRFSWLPYVAMFPVAVLGCAVLDIFIPGIGAILVWYM
jgi:hypothetical protein